MLTRIIPMLIILGIIAGLSTALYFSIAENAALRAKLGACNATITTSEDFNEGASNPDGRNWLDRLRGAAAD